MAAKPKRKAAPAKGEAKATPAEKLAKRWCGEIERYDRGTQKWRERAGKIEKKYLDEDRSTDSTERRFAILWANTETMKPATFARRPQAVVSRLWEKDDVGRRASEILERGIQTTFNLGRVEDVMEGVRDDRLLAARGTGWVRYEADLDGDTKTGERVCYEFVHWSDFGHTLARNWMEVSAVWRVVYMTREKVKARGFANAEAVKLLKYEVQPDHSEKYGEDADAFEPQAKIHEIWDKANGKTVWLNKSCEAVLEEGPPPLDLREFFPCPRPVYGSKSTRSLIPVPDYRYYQDQAEEIDDLTAKIANLTGWLRLKGFIAQGPSSEGGDAMAALLKIEQQMASTSSQVLVPVESWAGFQDKGGAKGLIEWIPLDQIIVALREAIAARKELKSDVFELTGISDILRGESDPNETLGAQQLKAQTGTRRISTVQRDLARFARDLAELAGEIIAEHFSPETLSEMSGFDLTTEAPPELTAQRALLQQQLQQLQAAASAPPALPAGAPPAQIPGAPMAPAPGAPDPAMLQQLQEQLEQIDEQLKAIEFNAQVMQLLRDEKTRGMRIDIETDSTIEPDEQAEKQRAVECLEAIGQFMQQAIPALQLKPELAGMFKEMLLFLVRRFRAGKSLEDVIERTMGEIEEAAEGHDPHANPEAEKMQAELQMKQQQHQQSLEAQGQQHQQTLQAASQRHQEVLQAQAQQHQQTLAAQAQQHEQKLALAEHQFMQKQAADEQARKGSIDFEREKHGLAEGAASAKDMAGHQIQALTGQLAAAGDGLGQVMQMIAEIKDHAAAELAAPIEIIRDDKGKVAGARKGKRVVQLKREAAPAGAE